MRKLYFKLVMLCCAAFAFGTMNAQTCASPTVLVSGVTLSGETTCGTGADLLNNPCSGNYVANNPGVEEAHIYSYTTGAAAEDITVLYDPMGTTWTGVSLVTSPISLCDDPVATCIGSSLNNGGLNTVNAIGVPAATTVYVYISTFPSPNCVPLYDLTLTAVVSPCGDGVCDAGIGETWVTCPADCPAPDYANCGTAVDVSAGGTFTTPTIEGTLEDFCAAGSGPTAGNWYVYTATSNGTLLVENCGSTIDSQLGIATGTCGTLTSLVCSDDDCGLRSSAEFTVVAGTDYYIQWTNGWSSNGFDFNVTFTAPPALPPVCRPATANLDPACGNYNFDISWGDSLDADGYAISVGTMPGGTDIEDSTDLGDVLSYTVSAPTAGTTYYWTIYPYNAAGANAACLEESVTTAAAGCYCQPVYGTTASSGCLDGDVIFRVILNTLDNNTGSTCPSGIAGYNDYSADPTLTTTLVAGTSYNCEVFAGQWGEGYKVWIDYNNDLTFDASEVVGNTTSAVAGSGAVGVQGSSAVFPISIACNPLPGNYRMRIRCVYNQAGPGLDPCIFQSNWGEVEDYTITIAPPPPCPTPANLMASAAGLDSIVLDWDTGCAEMAWDVSIETMPVAPAGAGTNSGVGNNISEVISGLTPGTDYYAYVRANCGGMNGESAWLGPLAFSTLDPPPVNDECIFAEVLTVYTAGTSAGNETTGSTATATPSAQHLDPSCDGVGTNYDVFYSFTTGATGTSVTFLADGLASGSLEGAVWDACGGTAAMANELACYGFGAIDGQSLEGLTPMTTYVLQIWTDSPNANDFTIAIEAEPFCGDLVCNGTESFFSCPGDCPTPPDPFNDDICGATAMTTAGGNLGINSFRPFTSTVKCGNSITQSNTGATATGSTEASCGGGDGRSVWFVLTIPGCDDGAGMFPFDIEVSTDNTGTTGDTKLEIFSSDDGTCTGVLTSLGCSDDNGATADCDDSGSSFVSTVAAASASLMSGGTYYILVDEFGGNSDIDYELTVSALPAAPTVTSNTTTNQIDMDAGDSNSSLYIFKWRPAGSAGYAIKYTSSSTWSANVGTGVDYEVIADHRCTAGQTYTSDVATVTVDLVEACEPLASLACEASGEGSITVMWNEVAGLYTNGGLLSGYILYYNEAGTPGYNYISNPSVSCVGGVCNYTINGLTDGVDYDIYLRTRCTATSAKKSNEITCTAGETARPDAPVTEPVLASFDLNGISYVDINMMDDWNDFGIKLPINTEGTIDVSNGSLQVLDKDGNAINLDVEATASISFDLVPNPTQNATTIRLSNVTENATYTITDLQGKLIASDAIAAGTSSVNVNTSNINTGIYMVTVVSGSQSKTEKLVILK